MFKFYFLSLAVTVSKRNLAIYGGLVLKILHIWNTAGVASILAKFQHRILDWDTNVLAMKKFDPYGLTTYGEVIRGSKYLFLTKVIIESRKYDILHIHDFDRIVPILKRIYPKKKVVLHYHGSRIRGKWRDREKYWSRADAIIVSTKDLLEDAPQGTIHLPNPVDTDIFKPLNINRKRKGLVIIKSRRKHVWSKLKKLADELARKMGLTYDVIFTDDTPIPYQEMPLLLNSYEYYLDLHHGYTENHLLIKEISKTGLEALACKTKVILWNGSILTDLPSEHVPENVVIKLQKIYESII